VGSLAATAVRRFEINRAADGITAEVPPLLRGDHWQFPAVVVRFVNFL
jgi:hypothetical protein